MPPPISRDALGLSAIEVDSAFDVEAISRSKGASFAGVTAGGGPEYLARMAVLAYAALSPTAVSGEHDKRKALSQEVRDELNLACLASAADTPT